MLPAYSPYPSSAPDDADHLGSVPLIDRQRLGQRGDQSGRGTTATQVAFSTARTRQGFSLQPVWRSRILLILNQLSVMSQNGIEIADALEHVAETCPDRRLARSLRAIHQSVNAGHSLSTAVAGHGVFFPPTLAPMLAAAEASGDVPETLGRVCKRLRGEVQMRGTIIGAMIYPTILLGASSVVMSALILGVLPQFGRVFESMGKPVPLHTQFLLGIGQFCGDYWYLLLLGLIGVATGLFVFRRHAIIRRPVGRFLMYGPLIRDAYRPLQAGRTLRTIASMVQGGVPLLQSVQLTQRTTQDAFWTKLLTRIEGKLIDGLPASSALIGVDFVPPETPQLMATAEKTGRVAEVLEDIGAFYEEEAERRIKRLVVMLEPAIIIVMGLIVAGVVMSVMLPLLEVSTIG